MRTGKDYDEFFIRFSEAKRAEDIESVKDLLHDLDSLPDKDRSSLSGLYMDVEDYICDMAEEEEEYALEY